MNYDEIPAGPELDALVYEKIFGKTPGDMRDAPCPDCGGETRIGNGRMWCYSCSEWKYQTTPEYSTDIAAAWLVVEKLSLPEKADGFKVSIRRRFSRYDEDRDKTVWEAGAYELVPWEGEEFIFSSEADSAPLAICRFIFSSEADSAPLAICRAALKAKGGDVS